MLALVLLLCAPAVRAANAEETVALANGGFEAGTAGWSTSGAVTLRLDPTRAAEGATSGLLTSTAQTTFTLRSGYLAATPGADHTLRIAVDADAAVYELTVTLELLDASRRPVADVAAGVIGRGGFARVIAGPVRSPQAAWARVVISGRAGAANARVWIDGASITRGPPRPAATATAPSPPPPPPAEGASDAPPAPVTAVTPSPAVAAARLTAAPNGALRNGDFEAVATLDGWRRRGGSLSVEPSPFGAGSAAVLSSNTTATKWIYQIVTVSPGGWYEAAALLSPDGGVARAWVRLAWYASDDGSGRQLAVADSPEDGERANDDRAYSTGAILAPPEAHSAQLRLVLRPMGAGAARLTVDDVRFEAVDAPSSMIESPATSTASDVLPASLTNPGFEDGPSLDGWGRRGGAASTGRLIAGEGRSALLVSTSPTMTWLYQRLAVRAEQWYEAGALLLPDGAAAGAWVRVVWYASADASGPPLAFEDAPAVTASGGPATSIARVRAPAGARSAQLRVVLRPAGGAAARLAIDRVRFTPIAPPEATLAPVEPPARTVRPPSNAPATSSVPAGAPPAEPPAVAVPELATSPVDPGRQRLVRITELLPDPVEVGQDAAYEWVELTNVGSEPAPLDGMTLVDNSGVAIELPAITLPAGASIVIAGQAASVDGALVYRPPEGMWNGLANDGDRLELRAAGGFAVDALSYGAGADASDDSPLPRPAPGHSIERRFDASGALIATSIEDAPSPGRTTIVVPAPDAASAGSSVAEAEGPPSSERSTQAARSERGTWLLLALASAAVLALAGWSRLRVAFAGERRR